MNTAVARPYTVPQSGGSGRAIALAIVMHVLLGGLLFFGIRWQSSPPAVIQAELWSAVPQTAAPAPRPAVVPAPPPRPEPKVEPDPPPPKADIVERAPPKVEPKRKPVIEPPKVQPKPQPPVKVETRQKPEPSKLPPKPAVDAPPRAPSELDALLAAAGKESTGKDQQTSGPRGRDSYIARLVTAIRSQMRYPASATGNPFATLRIEQLPNGDVVNVTVTKPSGVQAFDDAVERAVRAASPLPRDEQGKVERRLDLDYYMYDRK